MRQPWIAVTALALTILITSPFHALAAEPAAAQTKPPAVEPAKIGEKLKVHLCGDKLCLAGQPSEDDIAQLKASGFRRVISLRKEDEIDWDESARLRDAQIEFIPVPFQTDAELTDEVFLRIRQLLTESDQTPTVLHCGSATRVAAVWLTHRVLDQKVDLDTALAEAKNIGLRSPALEAKAKDYIQRQQSGQKSP
ncbi:MAG: sulfur transferase domain-containing protein [Pirellulales bacterium]